MSTRCNVRLLFSEKDFSNGMRDFWLYHHCDGYPEGVGSDLSDFLDTKNEDIDKGWRVTMCDILDEIVRKGVPGRLGGDKGDKDYEITTGRHGDIEYLYTIWKEDDGHFTMTTEEV